MTGERLPLVDVLRGLALWAMFVFHLTWDLAQFGWIDAHTTFAPGFRWFGHAIAASFLLLVGVSLVLAGRSGGPLWRSPKFWRRWATIAAAAAAISAVSFWQFPASPIFFGILHCIALASLIALPLLDAPPLIAVALGALCLVAPHVWSSPAFDGPIFWWTGLSTFEPASNDYRPLLPWLAFVLFGVALARIWLPLPASVGRGRGVRGRSLGFNAVDHVAPPERAAPASGGALRALAFCGRHSLAFYLIHQPVLFGLFMLIGQFVAPPPNAATFLRDCAVVCVNGGAEAGLCEKACACLMDGAKTQGFWPEMASGRMTPAQKSTAHDEAVACYARAVEN